MAPPPSPPDPDGPGAPDSEGRDGRDGPDPDGPGAAQPDAGWLQVTRTCRVPLSELSWRFTTSGGPGGQHANRSQTAAEVTFDVAASPSLGPRQKARLLDRLGPVVRASASDERSQLRNRHLALDRLRSRLAEALAVPRPRRPTAPSPAARRRRREDKARRSDLKRSRSRPPEQE